MKPTKEITIDGSTLSPILVKADGDVEAVNITAGTYTLTGGITIDADSRYEGQEYRVTYDGDLTLGTGGSLTVFGRSLSQDELDNNFIMTAVYINSTWVTSLVKEEEFSNARVIESGGVIKLQYKTGGVWTDTSTTWEI